MEILNLFSTQVFAKQCNLNLEKLKNHCYSFQKNNESVTISNVGGYQGPFFEYPELVYEIVNSLPKNPNKPLNGIEASLWLNINGQDDYNFLHSHAPFIGNALSGVFYVKAPKDSGNIYLYDPRGVLTSAIDQNYYNDSNRYYYIEPFDNLLIIFPSWLEHCVGANNSQEDRISIAFNIRLEY